MTTTVAAAGSAIQRVTPRPPDADGNVVIMPRAVGSAIPKVIPRHLGVAGSAVTMPQAAGSATQKVTPRHLGAAGSVVTMRQAAGSATPKATRKRHAAAGNVATMLRVGGSVIRKDTPRRPGAAGKTAVDRGPRPGVTTRIVVPRAVGAAMTIIAVPQAAEAKAPLAAATIAVAGLGIPKGIPRPLGAAGTSASPPPLVAAMTTIVPLTLAVTKTTAAPIAAVRATTIGAAGSATRKAILRPLGAAGKVVSPAGTTTTAARRVLLHAVGDNATLIGLVRSHPKRSRGGTLPSRDRLVAIRDQISGPVPQS